VRVARIFTVVLLSFLLGGGVEARQDDEITAVKTEDGVLLVWNRPNDYFTIEIRGREIRPLDSSGHVFFNVDGIVLQVQSVAVSEFLKDAGKAGESPQSMLAVHRDWETRFIESSLSRKLKVRSSAVKLKEGGEALFWKYDIPKGVGSDASQQLYLSAVNGRSVLLLNGVVTGKHKEEAVRRLLVNTMETLRKSPKPFDLQELQESLRRGDPR
jgi:hypothetical protein